MRLDTSIRNIKCSKKKRDSFQNIVKTSKRKPNLNEIDDRKQFAYESFIESIKNNI